MTRFPNNIKFMLDKVYCVLKLAERSVLVYLGTLVSHRNLGFLGERPQKSRIHNLVIICVNIASPGSTPFPPPFKKAKAGVGDFCGFPPACALHLNCVTKNVKPFQKKRFGVVAGSSKVVIAPLSRFCSRRQNTFSA